MEELRTYNKIEKHKEAMLRRLKVEEEMKLNEEKNKSTRKKRKNN